MPKSDIKIIFPNLPVSKHVNNIVNYLKKNQVLIVSGDTGTGKSTQLPKIALLAKLGIVNEGIIYDVKRKIKGTEIVCTQPRRIATRSIAQRIADECKCDLGQAVGYQMRFENETSPNTVIKTITDGLLLSENQSDFLLKKYSTIIIDEAHERSLNIDFLLGILKKIIAKRKDLRIIISSATLEAEKFSLFFGGAKILQVEDKHYPIDIFYRTTIHECILEIEEIETIGGAILIFLPGEKEIYECIDYLEEKLSPKKYAIYPLFSRLSKKIQADALRPNFPNNKIKIIVASNVAETSLTIENVDFVIDCGLARIKRYNPNAGINRLQIEEVSQANLRQRAGRAGRLRKGYCFRLFPEKSVAKRDKFPVAEIKRSSLAEIILQMKTSKMGEIDDFPFIDKPQKKLISEGLKTLEDINAIDERGKVTEIGREISKTKLDVKIARCLIAGEKLNFFAEMVVITSFLSIPDPRLSFIEIREQAKKKHKRWHDDSSDFITILNLHNAIKNAKSKTAFCKQNYLDRNLINEWSRLQNELANGKKIAVKNPDYFAIHTALLKGFTRQIALYNSEKKKHYTISGQEIFIFSKLGFICKKSKKSPFTI